MLPVANCAEKHCLHRKLPLKLVPSPNITTFGFYFFGLIHYDSENIDSSGRLKSRRFLPDIRFGLSLLPITSLLEYLWLMQSEMRLWRKKKQLKRKLPPPPKG